MYMYMYIYSICIYIYYIYYATLAGHFITYYFFKFCRCHTSESVLLVVCIRR